MKLDILNDKEFIKLALHQTEYNTRIVEEWIKRFRIGYPYRLDEQGVIYNVVLGERVEDEYCDKLIVEQAERIRANK